MEAGISDHIWSLDELIALSKVEAHEQVSEDLTPLYSLGDCARLA
jgi:hypothetical protein